MWSEGSLRWLEVFPARAGMSPAIETAWNKVKGFPRPRGDEPGKTETMGAVGMFSPPARG
mgnify:CR=1